MQIIIKKKIEQNKAEQKNNNELIMWLGNLEQIRQLGAPELICVSHSDGSDSVCSNNFYVFFYL